MNLYWVGNTGNWSDNTNHWSTSSGGSPGASKPTSSDNVIFDGNSFSSNSTVTVDEEAFCNNLSFGLDQLVSFEGSADINIYGNLILDANWVPNFTGGFIFCATDTGHTIELAGKVLPSYLKFNGVGGGWSISGGVFITHDSGIIVDAGTIDLSGTSSLQTKKLSSTATTNPAQLILGSKTMSLTGSSATVFDISTATNFSISGTSYILLCTNSGANVYGNTNTSVRLKFNNTGNIKSSSRFSYLELTPNYTYTVDASTTITINTLVGSGTAGNLVTLQSSSAGSAFNLTIPDGRYSGDYMSIKDCHGLRVGRLYAGSHSTNVSGNTGWIFRDIPRSALPTVF